MKNKFLIATLFTFYGASAMAQSTFEGGYVQFGIGAETVAPSYTGGSVKGISYSVTGDNLNSITGTFGAGYYFSLTPIFLLGIGAEYSPFTGSKANFSATAGPISFTDQHYIKNSHNIFISPSIAVSNNKLLYAKLGYTVATMAEDHSFVDMGGYSLGLGYKQFISGGLYGFGEVNYASSADKSVRGDPTGSYNIKITNVFVGLGYRF